MTRQPKRGTVRKTETADSLADTPEYLVAWAKSVVKEAGKREARLVLADYKAIAANRRLAKEDREIAAGRAKALERFL